MDQEKSGLEQAKAAAGGPVALSNKLKDIGLEISSQAISQWKEVPPLRVLDVERVSGVPRHILRPDLYPAPDRAEMRSA